MKFVTNSSKLYGSKLAEYADFFRTISDEIDANPNAIYNYFSHPSVTLLTQDKNVNSLQRIKNYEALSYGDVGVLFACPRTCLTGIMLREIGTQEQQEYYFDYIKQFKARSFFATTEPNYGSDAKNIETKIEIGKEDSDWLYLTGEKMLVGNIACANIGVIIARSSEKFFGLRAVLVTPENFSLASVDHYYRQTFQMAGIKPALLGYAWFNQFPIQKRNLLGEHIHPSQRGMAALLKTFNKMRLGIAALAIGHAQGILDYIKWNRSHLSRSESLKLDKLEINVKGIRQLNVNAAISLDKNPLETSLISLVKLNATKLAEHTAKESLSFFGKGVFLEHPFIAKRYRDAFAFEYMDGTENMQRKNIYQGYVNNVFK